MLEGARSFNLDANKIMMKPMLEGTRSFNLDANKIMMKQLELLQQETSKEGTTADEKAQISLAMATIYKTVLDFDRY